MFSPKTHKISLHIISQRIKRKKIQNNSQIYTTTIVSTIVMSTTTTTSSTKIIVQQLEPQWSVSSYNNIEIQDAFDIYTSYRQLLSKNDSFFYAQQTSFDKQNHPSSPLGHPHNNHKHKHQTEMNIPLYDFMRKTWMILVGMRMKTSTIREHKL